MIDHKKMVLIKGKGTPKEKRIQTDIDMHWSETLKKWVTIPDKDDDREANGEYYPYHPFLKYISNNNMDIVFHHTGSKQAEKILKEGFIAEKYAEKRKAIFASGNTINEFYSRTGEGETFSGQSPVKIPIDIRNLKLFDATVHTPNSEIGTAIIHGDLSKIPPGYDGIIKFLSNGDIYEVALSTKLATERIFTLNKLNEYFTKLKRG